MAILAPDHYALFDQLYDVLDSPARPADFGVVLTFAPGLADPHAALVAGLQQARARLARVGARPRGRRWVKSAEERLLVERGAGPSAEKQRAYRAFMQRDRDGQRLLQLAYFDEELGRHELLSRCHHALGDGATHLQILALQLRAAFDLPLEAGPEAALALRAHDAPRPRAPHAHVGGSDALAARGAGPMSARRHWLSVALDAPALREFASRAGGFTYGDLLADCTLQAVARWNARHAPSRAPRVGVFLSCNVRAQWWRGLGNGSSRVRLYARGVAEAETVARCRALRAQLEWAMHNGEWALRVPSFVERLPAPARGLLLRAALRGRDWDPGTLLLAHVERLGQPDWDEALPMVEAVQLVSLLSRRFALACLAATHRGRTLATFTYDPALIPDHDARALAELFAAQAEAAAPGCASLVHACASA